MSEASLNLQEANPFLERIQDKVQLSKLIESMYESGGSPMPELEDFLRSL